MGDRFNCQANVFLNWMIQIKSVNVSELLVASYISSICIYCVKSIMIDHRGIITIYILSWYGKKSYVITSLISFCQILSVAFDICYNICPLFPLFQKNHELANFLVDIHLVSCTLMQY